MLALHRLVFVLAGQHLVLKCDSHYHLPKKLGFLVDAVNLGKNILIQLD
jgi:hypothetical protein